MGEIITLAAIFFAVLIVSFTIGRFFINRREMARNLAATGSKRRKADEDINKILGSANPQIQYYLDVVQNDPENSPRMRLVQAGFFSESALKIFNLIRLGTVVVVFTVVQVVLAATMPSANMTTGLIVAALVSGVVFILTSSVLEQLGRRRTREYRKLFPDFMDLLLVCVDSGLSINAAIDRVTREFLRTTPDFGVQLSIINLEIRAGRPLHEALSSFSKRINVEEAKILSVLLKQSQELGTSIGKSLRVFSDEMRQLRLIRAEEKANSLPVKMLFPMAVFMFPVNLVIVLVPILMVIMTMLGSMAPS